VGPLERSARREPPEVPNYKTKFLSTERTVKKKEDLELVAEQMRNILNNPKAHARDKVAAGKLLSQLEFPWDPEDNDEFSFDPMEMLRACE
jgi:hypothetical protein